VCEQVRQESPGGGQQEGRADERQRAPRQAFRARKQSPRKSPLRSHSVRE
jgi:hypothetical protein